MTTRIYTVRFTRSLVATVKIGPTARRSIAWNWLHCDLNDDPYLADCAYAVYRAVEKLWGKQCHWVPSIGAEFVSREREYGRVVQVVPGPGEDERVVALTKELRARVTY